ncbi:IS110 family transposase [bacterium]|nr:IS110 family transposase [bacterium]
MDTVRINAEFFCGVDLHARTTYLCVMNREGETLLKRNIPNHFKTFKGFIDRFTGDLAVGCESTYNYYWLLDGCRDAGIPFYLGHALYMKAISGNKKKSDPLDAATIANLMRTNYFPQAYPYPREMRATRDLFRRRTRLVRIRAESYTHTQLVMHQHAITDVKSSEVKNRKTRRALLERLEQPDVRTNVETDLDIADALDPLIARMEERIKKQALYHNPKHFRMLLTIPGVGDMIALNTLYETHDIGRFRKPQAYSSYCRVVKCQRSSAGKPSSHKNQKIGNPYLKWAYGQMALYAIRASERIEKLYHKMERKYGTQRARARLRHKLAVAVYFMLKNNQAFDEERFVTSSK